MTGGVVPDRASIAWHIIRRNRKKTAKAAAPAASLEREDNVTEG
jgi:hypothetical protein